MQTLILFALPIMVSGCSSVIQDLCGPTPPDGLIERAVCVFLTHHSAPAFFGVFVLVLVFMFVPRVWRERADYLEMWRAVDRKLHPQRDLVSHCEELSRECANVDYRAIDPGETASPPLRDIYVSLCGMLVGHGALVTQKHSLISFVKGHPKLAVVGRGGLGKTTFLRYVAVFYAEAITNPHGDKWLAKVQPELVIDPLPAPVFLPLIHFDQFLLELKQKNRDEYLQVAQHRKHEALRSCLASKTWGWPGIEKYLKEQKCIVFLDGLDEVPSSRRPLVVELVVAFANHYVAGVGEPGVATNRLIVTMRPEAGGKYPALPRFAYVHISDLDDEQVEEFVRRWHEAVMGGPDAKAAAMSLLTALRDDPDAGSQLVELTRRPLLLATAAITRHQTPESWHWRTRLLERCVHLLLEGWEAAPHKRMLGRPVVADREQVPGFEEFDQKVAALQRAAFWMLEQGQASARFEDFTRAMEPPSGEEAAGNRRDYGGFVRWGAARGNILDLREDNTVAFVCPIAFRDFLAARHIVQEGCEASVIEHLGDPFWDHAVGLLLEQLALLEAVSGGEGRLLEFARAAIDRDPVSGAISIGRLLRRAAVAEETRAVARLALPALSRAGRTARNARERALARECLGAWRHAIIAMRRSAGRPCGQERVRFVFVRGDGVGTNGPPAHCGTVSVPYDYFISKHPITVAQYQLFVEAGGYSQSAISNGGFDPWGPDGRSWLTGELDKQLGRNGQSLPQELVESPVEERWAPAAWQRQLMHPDRPVTGVTWYEAVAYCRWLAQNLGLLTLVPGGVTDNLSARLPTDDEWLKAACGGGSSNGETGCAGSPVLGRALAWPWGDTFDPNRANTNETGIGAPSPVGTFPEGASWCGCEDLSGNVWEWCEISHDVGRTRGHRRAPSQIKIPTATIRGGSYLCGQELCRCDSADKASVAYRSDDIGFRVVLIRSP